MELKLTQFPQTPATCSTVCSRCGYRMFRTKSFIWLCGPGCDGAQQWHSMTDVHQEQDDIFQGKDLVGKTKH